jgi:ubiquinone/menaquinone biosynthesis C-methylase UbiE
MKPDPNYQDYIQRWTSAYKSKNYDSGLAARLLLKSHFWCERAFGSSHHFSRVLEVGAGTGIHLKAVRHSFDQYIMTDLSLSMLGQISVEQDVRRDKIFTQREDATALGFSDASFDRVIAAHVLEHLSAPHLVLREWARVLKPGGTLSIVLPCDPGVAWRTGRHFGSRRKFESLGIDYDYWMAREHVNSITNLIALLRYYFSEIKESWYPFKVPLSDVNLFYIAHIVV